MTGISRKTMIPRLIQLLFLALLPALVLAETAEKQQARVERLEHAVLAPCCYTEPVAIHQSEIAVKMRLEIAKWVAAGRSDREIIDTYVGLYGSKVLVDPRTLPRGWMPFFPWLVLILGMFLVVWLLKRWRAAPRIATASFNTEVLNLPDVDDEWPR
jgi:cytochrome c-type biogenesis protein CcmH/NrfF